MGISLSDYRCYDGRAEKTEATWAVQCLVNKHRTHQHPQASGRFPVLKALHLDLISEED